MKLKKSYNGEAAFLPLLRNPRTQIFPRIPQTSADFFETTDCTNSANFYRKTTGLLPPKILPAEILNRQGTEEKKGG